VASGTGRDDDREFHDPANREVAQRYRYALAELERAGLIERDGESRRLTAMGWPAARLMTRQELDRIAARTRHLTEAEQRLLRLLANCREQYKVSKIVLRRDGSSMSAVYGNGLTVHVPDVCPLDETFPEAFEGDAALRFEELATGIPEDYSSSSPSGGWETPSSCASPTPACATCASPRSRTRRAAARRGRRSRPPPSASARAARCRRWRPRWRAPAERSVRQVRQPPRPDRVDDERRPLALRPRTADHHAGVVDAGRPLVGVVDPERLPDRRIADPQPLRRAVDGKVPDHRGAVDRHVEVIAAERQRVGMRGGRVDLVSRSRARRGR
jgi:hypothetical protein